VDQPITLLAYVQEVLRTPTVVTEGFCSFPQSSQENDGIVRLVRPQPLPSTFFETH
jgi:hypothetical protein